MNEEEISSRLKGILHPYMPYLLSVAYTEWMASGLRVEMPVNNVECLPSIKDLNEIVRKTIKEIT